MNPWMLHEEAEEVLHRQDQNRVPTGYLRGDACNCEPQALPVVQWPWNQWREWSPRKMIAKERYGKMIAMQWGYSKVDDDTWFYMILAVSNSSLPANDRHFLAERLDKTTDGFGSLACLVANSDSERVIARADMSRYSYHAISIRIYTQAAAAPWSCPRKEQH